ncbi:hypothetical protein DNTS_013227 [Danionella cerebrum]|uniref:Uncharacterized protein n=1 Tax=Danionella cerebrum TaxID=2873325 RepID=A0A553Q5Q9_9TELE|nr:hypothetical protein DNTS_013227 [Danionella translucida]
MQKLFHLVLILGLLGLSVEGQNSTGSPVITGLRITVKSLVDLTSNSVEMELLVRQIRQIIPPTHREMTYITPVNLLVLLLLQPLLFHVLPQHLGHPVQPPAPSLHPVFLLYLLQSLQYLLLPLLLHLSYLSERY